MPSPRKHGIYIANPVDEEVYTGKNPMPISGTIEGNVTTTVTTAATDLQFDSTTVTEEQPLPISGMVELESSTPANLQYNDTTVTRESPLPISGMVELESSTPANLQYNDISVTGESPLPVSGTIETVGTSNLQYNDVTVTGESPLPVSGLVDVIIDGITGEDPLPVSGVFEIIGAEVTTDDPLPVSGQFSGPETGPRVFNIEIAASGTEYSQALPSPCYGFDMRPSGSYALQVAFVAGNIALEQYFTISSGSSYGKEFMKATTGPTIYVQSEFDDTIGGEASRGAQIVAWTE
jgi:hypothetical protein